MTPEERAEVTRPQEDRTDECITVECLRGCCADPPRSEELSRHSTEALKADHLSGGLKQGAD